jgi:hypothetical protein
MRPGGASSVPFVFRNWPKRARNAFSRSRSSAAIGNVTGSEGGSLTAMVLFAAPAVRPGVGCAAQPVQRHTMVRDDGATHDRGNGSPAAMLRNWPKRARCAFPRARSSGVQGV